jgi:sterol desaturase/sphingolipid hydroxylase (fatty acid hydroxylase superfamily)
MEILRSDLLLYITAPLQTCLILIEIMASKFGHRKFYNLKDTAYNLYLMLLNLMLDLGILLLFTTPILRIAYNFKIMEISNPFLYWFTLLLFEDFMFYWLHFFDHKIRLFWAVHVTHHSSENYNLTVGFRSSVLQPIYRFLYFLPIAFLGFKPLDIMFMYSVTQLYGSLIHTRFINKMGFLEYFMATPSNHRVHHASNTKYLDKNMGMVFIIWDKLFGTFQDEIESEHYEPIKFGLTKEIENNNPVNVVFHEWREIISDLKKPLPLKIKLKYLYMPPGWSHDGSRKTSQQLREIENTNTPKT